MSKEWIKDNIISIPKLKKNKHVVDSFRPINI